MKTDLTPWARQQLAASLQNQLASAEPVEARVHLGRGRSMWRALVTLNGHVLADVIRRDPNLAAIAVLEQLGAPIDS